MILASRLRIVTIITMLLFAVPLILFYALGNNPVLSNEATAPEYGLPLIATLIIGMFFFAYDIGLVVEAVRNRKKNLQPKSNTKNLQRFL